MEKIKALIEKYKPLILALARSRTMQGIAVTAVGTVLQYAKAHLSASLIDLAGEMITAAAASLQVGGLGWAIKGRLNAAGPIALPADVPIAVASPPVGEVGEGAKFDGTGGELP